MSMTNRNWLPGYCDPHAYLPKIQETRGIFLHPPFLFRDFVGKALTFLTSDRVKKMGFEYNPENTLPCKWKCADEAVFGVDLAIYANTGHHPFDKGLIGGRFNDGSLRAAVHHGQTNVDFGGSHMGYVPGPGGGSFGSIYRPLTRTSSTDCGYLMGRLEDFRSVYDDACANIHVFNPDGGRLLLSIPNEFLQPSWSVKPIKLLIDTETLTAGTVPYKPDRQHTHTPMGRTLFYVRDDLLGILPDEDARRLGSPEPTPISRWLSYPFFNIFDTTAELDEHGLPRERLNLYMKHILTARNSPSPLKAAIVNANLEYNRLTDAVRSAAYRDYAFASFTGIFIDMFSEQRNNYINLFQPLGVSIKPAGTTDLVELLTEEIFHIFEKLSPAEPAIPLANVMGFEPPADAVERFTFRPGYFQPVE